jgi:tetratricopeptide (TPR) repeat protein
MISRLKKISKLFLSVFILMSLTTPSFGEGPKGDELEKATKFFEKGNLLSQKKNFMGAISAYERSIEINPNLGSVHYNLANIYVAINDLDSAIAEYKKAIKLDPKMSDFHRNLGFAYALKKDGENAKKTYEELKKMDPVQAEVLFQWIQQGK